MITFSDWLEKQGIDISEVASDTGQVANFSRPVGGMVKRMAVKPIVTQPNGKTKKEKVKDAHDMEKDFHDLD